MYRIKFVVFFLTLPLFANAQADTKPLHILFVCEHGAARSVIASKYFEQVASQNGVNAIVQYRGISPDSIVGKVTRQNLVKEGFQVSNARPGKLNRQIIDESDLIILLDCQMPSGFDYSKEKVLRFSGIPSISENYNAASDSIRQIVQQVFLQIRKDKLHK